MNEIMTLNPQYNIIDDNISILQILIKILVESNNESKIKLQYIMSLINNDTNIKNNDMIDWYELDKLLFSLHINQPSEHIRKKQIHFIVHNLTILYNKLLQDINEYELEIKKYKESMISLNETIDINNVEIPAYLYTNKLKTIENKVLKLINEKDKMSMIQKLIRWHSKSIKTESKTDYIIKISEIVTLIEYSEDNKESRNAFYVKKFEEFLNNYNCIKYNNCYRTNWYNLKMFIMLSSDITIEQKHLMMFYMKSYENHASKIITMLISKNHIEPFNFENSIVNNLYIQN
jgi:hypothetical protein